MACDAALQEKNVSNEMLDGKVGRMYVPRQEIGSIATRKMKVNQLLATPALSRRTDAWHRTGVQVLRCPYQSALESVHACGFMHACIRAAAWRDHISCCSWF